MKKTLIGLIVFLAISCDKTGSNIDYLQGNYIGYFHRTNLDTSEIRIRFNLETFEGSTSKQFYPSLCKGSFDQKENTINFIDSCSIKEKNDTSLMLKGNFKYEYYVDGTLRIWRNSGVIMDEYILRRTLNNGPLSHLGQPAAVKFRSSTGEGKVLP